MRAIENTTDRLVLAGASPLFRPFFVGGLGFAGPGRLPPDRRRRSSPDRRADRCPAASRRPRPPAMGVFLAAFGFFLAITPLAGRFPFRKEIVVDRAAGEFLRRDRTLVRLRQETYPLGRVRTRSTSRRRGTSTAILTSRSSCGSNPGIR